jgi:hypothetical protein
MYFTWRNIALFVIVFLIASYLMLLGIIVTVDRAAFPGLTHAPRSGGTHTPAL